MRSVLVMVEGGLFTNVSISASTSSLNTGSDGKDSGIVSWLEPCVAGLTLTRFFCLSRQALIVSRSARIVSTGKAIRKNLRRLGEVEIGLNRQTAGKHVGSCKPPATSISKLQTGWQLRPTSPYVAHQMCTIAISVRVSSSYTRF